MTQHVVVIGAGIVGVSSALWLLRSGCRVTLLDRDAPGQAASFGNAGLIASWAIVPVTTPGLMRDAPKYLLNPREPLFLRWSYLPRLLPWLAQFLSHANAADANRIGGALAQILGDSREQHLTLAQGGRAERYVGTTDFAFAYADRKGFEKDAFAWALRRAHGFEPDLIEGGAVRDYDPAFGPGIGCLARLGGMGHIRNPGAYVTALAEEFRAGGGQIRRSEARDILRDADGRARAVMTPEDEIACDRVVIATGAWSKRLAQSAGIKVPLEVERGYHVLMKNPEGGPSKPCMITTGKFGANPMEMGLRCAGVVELGGLKAGPSRAPLRLLRDKAREAFPDLRWQEDEEWLGHRPSLPDSLPMIGEIAASGIYTDFGHQHIGLTAGPKTGRLIADLITGKRPNIDLAPFAPNRFTR